MTAHRLKLVDDLTDQEIAGIEADMKAAKRKQALAKVSGPSTADVLPPDRTVRYDDLSNAERFLDIVGEDLLYVAEAKKWLIWSKSHWQFDTTNLVFDLAADFVKDLYSPENCRDETAFKHAKRSNLRSGLNALIDIAQRKRTVTMDTFDAQPFLLNCANGTLDLKTGELRSHDRTDRITRIIHCDYDAEAESPAYKDFLETIQPDPTIRAFLQRSIGYSLLGVARERSFWILHGTGANGKSVFINLFNNLLGDYASTTTSSSVMQGRSSSIPNDIARLRGKRFVVIPETEENERLNAALIKALSAGDNISARFLFGEWFDFYFSGKLWIATNHKPTISDHSKGFWDRLKLIPFTQSIPADKVIKQDDLLSTLQAESAGIMNWAVQGCRDYFEVDGLDVPEVIQVEIDRYKKEQDSIAQFIEEACRTYDEAVAEDPEAYLTPANFTVKNSDLYKAYKSFCEANGEFLRSHRRLTQNMHERGFRQINSAGRYWEGIELNEKPI